jgi:GNAT superfamily N-acetyltransferase
MALLPELTHNFMSIHTAESDAEIMACWPVLAQLRPHIQPEQALALIRQQFKEGYRLAFVRRDEKVVGAAGFRMLHNLAWGKFCYVDDLVIDETSRSAGVGSELIGWLREAARSEGCARLELDSGVQRFDAHRCCASEAG